MAVFGHAVFINAIAMELAEAAGCLAETTGSLLDIDLGETQGILVDLETGSITKKAGTSNGGVAVVNACKSIGVDQMLLVRHANSAPLAGNVPVRTDVPHHWKKEDQKRVLTAKGVEQCAAAASWFAALPLRCLLSSPARRAAETAVNMANRVQTEDRQENTLALRMVAGVHPAGMNETCEAMFETMGYGPFRKFFEAEDGEQAFRDYGNRVCDEISGQLLAMTTGGGSCVAVFGHAVFLNAIALEVSMAAGWSAEAMEYLLDMDLGEAQGILIDISTGSLQKMPSE